MRRQISRLLLLATAFFSMPAFARVTPVPPPDRAQIIRAARDVVQKAHFCAFITVGDRGQPQARVVDPSAPDDGFAVWVGTNPLTRKVAQIRKDPRVTLFYFDPAASAYVTLIGTAAVVSDPTERAKHWQEQWSSFYKDKHRGPDFALIRVRPRRLEIVSYPHGLGMDPQTWRPVSVEFESPRAE